MKNGLVNLKDWNANYKQSYVTLGWIVSNTNVAYFCHPNFNEKNYNVRVVSKVGLNE